MTDKTEKVKTIKGPLAAVASFIRARDGVRIWVFTRRGEGVEGAIQRVKKHNGSEAVEHQLVK